MKIILLVITFFSISLTSCKKNTIDSNTQENTSNNQKLLDYRDSFIVGTYQGLIYNLSKEHPKNDALPNISYSDTTYSGSVEITYDSIPNQVNVSLNNSYTIKIPKVEESPSYYKFATGSATGGPYYCVNSIYLEVFPNEDSISYLNINHQESGGSNSHFITDSIIFSGKIQ